MLEILNKSEKQIIELLKQDFNNKDLAKLMGCCAGQIYELRHKPVEGQVYHFNDINAVAIYDFMRRLEASNKLDVNEEFMASLEYICGKASGLSRATYKIGDSIANYVVVTVEKINGVYVYGCFNEVTKAFKLVKSTEMANLAKEG